MSYAYEQAPARAGEVGKHVGQFRVINGYQLRKFFGFRNSPNALGFSQKRLGGVNGIVNETRCLIPSDYPMMIIGSWLNAESLKTTK